MTLEMREFLGEMCKSGSKKECLVGEWENEIFFPKKKKLELT